MSKKKNRKRELPVTGILTVIVAILIICVTVLGWLLWKQGRQANTRQEPTVGQKGILQTETLLADEKLEKSPETDILESEVLITGEVTETELITENAEFSGMKSETEETENSETEFESVETELFETETEDAAEKLVVAIDPGHQGSWIDMSEKEPNAPGSSEMKAKATTGTEGRFSGKKEYELNLEVSLLLGDELEKRGYEVILTREDHDTAISNSERALMAYDEGGDIYVRIHANGADDSGVSGALAMVPSASNPYVGHLAEDSYLLADCILNNYCQSAQFESLGIQYYDNMTGINWSKLPVMILEMGFMTNESDDLRMADTQVQVKMVEGIADGIDEYFIHKGMKQDEASKKTEKSAEAEVSEADLDRMNALMEILGEEYVYPSMDAGEQWAVSVAELDTGAEGNINGDVPMKSASVIKVFIMATIYDRTCYPSSEERYIPIPESYEGELRQLISDMITVSDNSASNTLLEKLGNGDAQAGMAVVNQFCEENGYTGTSIGRKFLEPNPSGDNYTTANDCCRLLQSIYEGTCVNEEASSKMYAFLKNQTRTWKIPAGLSGTSAVTANKTGELAGDYQDYVENDIAIVEDGDSAYVLCVLSDDLRDNGNAMSQIGQISRMVYEHR